jgi:Holliday junction resolvase-like predicted endonuclease
MEIKKSTRHPKICGDFGEALVLYWLSKHGFECAKVDHTGIDLIAVNPHTKERMGISVKSRTREIGKENQTVDFKTGDFKMLEAACQVFDLKAYFAVVVDAGETIRVFITSTDRVSKYYPATAAGSYWKMSPSVLSKYAEDNQIMMFEFQTKQGNWWKPISN